MKPTFKIEGLEAALKKCNAVIGSMDPMKVEKVLLKGAQIISKESQRRAPKGPTGRLKKAHKARVSRRRRKYGAGAFSAIDRKIAPHAHLVELGTVAAPAHPYFRPAVDTTQGQVQKQIEADLKQLMGDAAK